MRVLAVAKEMALAAQRAAWASFLQGVCHCWWGLLAGPQANAFHAAFLSCLTHLFVLQHNMPVQVSVGQFIHLTSFTPIAQPLCCPEFAARHHATCRHAVVAAAHLDALCALAAVARSPGYVRPTIADDGAAPRLMISAGRHPTLDLALAPGGAVPNDIHLSWGGHRAVIITGACRWRCPSS